MGSSSRPDKASWTTSIVHTTVVHTITQCPPEVTSCPGRGHTRIITETIPISTTVCPVTSKHPPGKPIEKPSETPSYPTAPVSSSASVKPGHPSTTEPEAISWTTSTVYTTNTQTITKCPPEVTSCPGRGHTTVVTETVPVSTTVYPVTSVAPPATEPEPVSSAAPTKYTTQTYVVPSCSPGAPGCSAGSSPAETPTVPTVVLPPPENGRPEKPPVEQPPYQSPPAEQPSKQPTPEQPPYRSPPTKPEQPPNQSPPAEQPSKQPTPEQPPYQSPPTEQPSNQPAPVQPVYPSVPAAEPPTPTNGIFPSTTTGPVLVTGAARRPASSLTMVVAVAGLLVLV